MRRRFLSIALSAGALGALGALAGCVRELPPPVTVPAPPAASSEELRWAVEGALAARGWTVSDRSPGAITAYVVSQGTGDYATVEVSYRPGIVEVRCVKEDVSRQRYERWMQLLSAEIQKNAAQLGMRRPPAPPPPPATQ